MKRRSMTFSKGERGKFTFNANAELRFPIYLNADIQAYLAERAAVSRRALYRSARALTTCVRVEEEM